MITDTSWIVVRHPHAFLPPPWQTVLCKRDVTAEVLPGITERRSTFTLDMHSGQEWLRKGNGQYEYWTHLPTTHKWCAAHMVPPIQIPCIFWLNQGQWVDLHVGQVISGPLGNVIWQVQTRHSTTWSSVLSKQIGGWLLLPPDES